MNLAEKISNAEREVMEILWSREGPVSFSDIRVRLQETMGWEKSTIHTLLRRLVDKGVLTARKEEAIYYTANVSRGEYQREKERSLIDKLYDGSAKNFVAALCRRGELSEADIDELKRYFTMGGEGK